MNDREVQDLRDEIQRLRDEQQRLRDEQEHVRRERESQAKEKPDEARAKNDKNQESGDKSGEGDKEKKQDDSSAQPKPPLRERVRVFIAAHRKGIIFGALGTIVFVVLAVVFVIYLDSYESTDDAEVDGHLDPISSRVSGTVAHIYVEDDQPVQAGQLLVDLDPRDFQLAAERAQATYALATSQVRAENPNVPIINTTNETTITTGQSDLAGAQAGVVAAEQEYEAKKANLTEALANNTKAQMDVKRYQLLVQKEEISREQFDAVVANAETSAAAVEAARASAKAAEKAIDESHAQLQQAQSRLQQANENAPRAIEIGKQNLVTRKASAEAADAELHQAELNLSYLKIFAPVAGIIGQRTVEIGQRIQSGEQLMTISETSDIWITANFKETQLRRIHPGQPVDIEVDAYGTKYHGYVENMPGASGARTSLLPPENATGNFVKVVQRLPVRIRLNAGEDRQHLLKLGMSVEPKVWVNKGTR